MISSIISLLIQHFKYADVMPWGLWFKLMTCVLVEVIIYIIALKKLDKWDLKTNYGEKRMTKEELEKEVKEYISYNQTEGSKDFVVYKVRVGENAFAYVVEHKNELSMSDWIKIYEGTERECYRVVGYLDSAEPREKRIADLEAQIEKMKCCQNCKYFECCDSNHYYCSLYCGLECAYNKSYKFWEIKEK